MPTKVLAQSEFVRVCRSTLACFDRINLVQTRNHTPFVLLDSLFAKEVFVKNS